MEGIKNEIKMMGLPENNAFSVKDAKKIFRKKSFSMLPEKSLGSPNAHSQFEELNAAFVKLMNFKKEEGESIEDVMPGDVEVSKVQMVIKLKESSAMFWKRSIRQEYPTAIIGAVKKAGFIAQGCGKAVRHVVYWKPGGEGSSQPVKVNLVIYENDLLQVSGSGFFLWTMDKYQEMMARVNGLMSEVRVETTETTETIEEENVKKEEIEEPEEKEIKLCEGEKKCDKILGIIEKINDATAMKFQGLKYDIENVESVLNANLNKLVKRVEVNTERYETRNEKLQDLLNKMEERVNTLRQLAGASNMSGGRVRNICLASCSRGRLRTDDGC